MQALVRHRLQPSLFRRHGGQPDATVICRLPVIVARIWIGLICRPDPRTASDVYLYYDSNDVSIPEAGMFNEVAKNILFVVIPESDSYEAKTRMIRLGCSWALQRIRANENPDAKLNEKLTNMQSVLRTSLNSIKTVKNNSSAITIACKQLITDFETELGLTRYVSRRNNASCQSCGWHGHIP